jgi:hypothetical protein
MSWHRRLAAIALAGGSIAACSDAADSHDDSTVPPTRGAEREAGAPTVAHPHRSDVAPAPPWLAFQTGAAYVIPACNANPDPCCRMPGLPQCTDGGDAGEGGGEDDAGASWDTAK